MTRADSGFGTSTNRVSFCGRRGQMGKRSKLQVMEFMSALDDILGIDPKQGDGYKTLQELVNSSTIQVSVKAEGAGKVAMTPKNGMLQEGKDGELVAAPDPGNVFLDWRSPNGQRAGWSSRLTVNTGKPQGCYTARFRPRSDCLPPVLLSHSVTSLHVRAREHFKYTVKVSDKTRPVKFKLNKRPSSWIKLNKDSGILSGRFMFPGTNTLAITVIGSDAKRTEVPVRLKFFVEPSDDTGEKIDEEAPPDDEDEKSDTDADEEKEDSK